MPATSSGSVLRITKSTPRSMKRRTGSGAPLPMRPSTRLMLRSVRSGFCSEPESANSRPMMRSLSTNQE